MSSIPIDFGFLAREKYATGLQKIYKYSILSYNVVEAGSGTLNTHYKGSIPNKKIRNDLAC
jgi:hypothetical protein